MLPIELRASTGHPQVDNILRGLIGIYKTAFPGCLRCVYVVGSHSDGSAVPASDLDIGIVFHEPLTDEHRTQFRQINQSLALISPVRLDCGTVNPERFTHGIPAGLKMALVVYGEHIFNELPLEPIEQALRRTMSSTFHSLYVLRQRDETLVYPLKYPDPAGDYFGYERWGTYLGEREFAPGVRSLVTSATLIASCLVMLRTGQRIASKKESVLAYQTHIGDEWNELVQEIYGQCKVAWGYQLPENMEARQKLHDLCAKMLEFENHFLSHCREQILSDLLHPEKAIQEMALYRLNRIAYPGKDYEAALIALQGHEDIAIAQRAEAVFAKLKPPSG